MCASWRFFVAFIAIISFRLVFFFSTQFPSLIIQLSEYYCCFTFSEINFYDANTIFVQAHFIIQMNKYSQCKSAGVPKNFTIYIGKINSIYDCEMALIFK